MKYTFPGLQRLGTLFLFCTAERAHDSFLDTLNASQLDGLFLRVMVTSSGTQPPSYHLDMTTRDPPPSYDVAVICSYRGVQPLSDLSTQVSSLIINSAPSYESIIFLSLTLPSVCHKRCFFFFVSRWNRAIFGPSVHHDPLQNVVLTFLT